MVRSGGVIRFKPGVHLPLEFGQAQVELLPESDLEKLAAGFCSIMQVTVKLSHGRARQYPLQLRLAEGTEK